MDAATGPVGPIARLFQSDDAERQPRLNRIRKYAAFTKPGVLEFIGQTEGEEQPKVQTSLGPDGITNVASKMNMGLWTPGLPWFMRVPSPKVMYSQTVTPDRKQAIIQKLFLQDVLIQSTLESNVIDSDSSDRGRYVGFRTAKGQTLIYLLVAGDVLERLTDAGPRTYYDTKREYDAERGDSYRVKVYRPDQYTTRRDSCGDVLYHCVRECKDIRTISPKVLGKAQIDASEYDGKPVSDRICDQWECVEWQPYSRTWVIRQELHGKLIAESEETVSPFFSTPYELYAGENYGRGFVEQKFSDLATFNELQIRLLNFAAAASKMKLCVGADADVRDDELQSDDQVIIRGVRVEGGQVQNLAFLQSNKFNDFQVVHNQAQARRADLGRAMLIESEVTPQKERTTALQVSRVTAELQEALGQTYATIADQQQLPLLRRVIYQLERDKELPRFKKGEIRVDVLTGVQALANDIKFNDMLSFAQVVNLLGPEVAKRLNRSVLLDVLARYKRLSEPGLIKTQAEVDADDQKAIAQQAQMSANEAAHGAIANVATNVASANLLANQPTGQAPGLAA